MTREIKFRVWFPDSRNMVISSTIEKLLFEDGHYFSYSGKPDGAEIMQYTGLKDKKNGKEIYEGDIVITKEGKTGYVSYFAPSCRFDIERVIDGYEVPQYQCELAWYLEPEVLGNIYENPELLTKQQNNHD